MTALMAKGKPRAVLHRGRGLRQERRRDLGEPGRARAVVGAALAHPRHRRARRRLQARLDAHHPLERVRLLVGAGRPPGGPAARATTTARAAHGGLGRGRSPLQGRRRALREDPHAAHAQGRRGGSLGRLLAREARRLHRAARRDRRRRADLGGARARAVGALSRAGRDPRLAGDAAGRVEHALDPRHRGHARADGAQLRARLRRGQRARRRRHGARALRDLRRRLVRGARGRRRDEPRHRLDDRRPQGAAARAARRSVHRARPSSRAAPRACSSTRSSATASRATARRTTRRGRPSRRRSASPSCRASSRSTTTRRSRASATSTSTASTASTTRASSRSARRSSRAACSRASCSRARRRAASTSRTATGAGRRGAPSSSRQGNLVVEPKVAVPVAELRRRLREEAQRQGKPYGLLFRDISGGFTNTARGGPQAFKVLPIIVYRVWVDGRPDELVRGVDLVGTPLAALSRIMAAADDYQTFNGYCGAESGLRARLGDEPEPARAADRDRAARQGQRQAADLAAAAAGDLRAGRAPAPRSASREARSRVARRCSSCSRSRRRAAPRAGVRVDDAAVRAALGDELARSTTELRLGDEPRPYYVAYTISDAEQATVSATFGAVTAAHAYRGRLLRTDVRVGSPAFDNTNFEPGAKVDALPEEDDYAVAAPRAVAAHRRGLQAGARAARAQARRGRGPGGRRGRSGAGRLLEGAARASSRCRSPRARSSPRRCAPPS